MTRTPCFVLMIVLIATTASGDDAVKVDSVNSSNPCSESNPNKQCPLTTSSYPSMLGLVATLGNGTVFNEYVEKASLETLCSEEKSLLGCISKVLDKAPEKCLEQFKNKTLTPEHVSQVLKRTEMLCTAENLPKLSSHLHCILEPALEEGVVKCLAKHPGSDCSSDEVIKCSQPVVTSVCGADVAEFVKATENAVLCGILTTTLGFLSKDV